MLVPKGDVLLDCNEKNWRGMFKRTYSPTPVIWCFDFFAFFFFHFLETSATYLGLESPSSPSFFFFFLMTLVLIQ